MWQFILQTLIDFFVNKILCNLGKLFVMLIPKKWRKEKQKSIDDNFSSTNPNFLDRRQRESHSYNIVDKYIRYVKCVLENDYEDYELKNFRDTILNFVPKSFKEEIIDINQEIDKYILYLNKGNPHASIVKDSLYAKFKKLEPKLADYTQSPSIFPDFELQMFAKSAALGGSKNKKYMSGFTLEETMQELNFFDDE